MFRHDRPQAGRYRQFNQFGIEALGTKDPAVDAEVIAMAMQLFQSLGLTDLNLHINSVGCPKCRPVYREALITFFRGKEDQLCSDCKVRLERNPLRVLDCKEEGCKRASIGAPELTDNLCDDCREHLEKVETYLTKIGIEYMLDSRLVRGLDYYTNTAFEIMYAPLGAQSTVCGGGRYDGLVEEIGGPSTPGIGFAIGMERLLLTLKEQKLLPPAAPVYPVYIVALGHTAREEAFAIQQGLRKKNLFCEMDLLDRSMKGQMKYANKINAKLAIILGEEELSNQTATIRNMETKEQATVALKDVIHYIETGIERMK
jgi:histidyl-tRNA synthetase